MMPNSIISILHSARAGHSVFDHADRTSANVAARLCLPCKLVAATASCNRARSHLPTSMARPTIRRQWIAAPICWLRLLSCGI